MKPTKTLLLLFMAALLLLSACTHSAAPDDPADEPAATAADDAADGQTDAPDTAAPSAVLDPLPAYRAYLALLEQERDNINRYDWQKFSFEGGTSDVSRPVVLCDVWGDENPELIYIKCTDEFWQSTLNIVSYENGALRILYDQSWDCQVAGGVYYYLFQLQGDKTLYSFLSAGDEWWSYSYAPFREGADGLLVRDRELEHEVRPGETAETYHEFRDIYTQYGLTISEEDFQRAESDMQAATVLILMNSNNCGDFAPAFVSANGCPAMTADEAIARLKGLIPVEEPSAGETPAAALSWQDAYRSFVLSRSFLDEGDREIGYGDLENGAAPVSFALYDMDGDDSPELLVFNGFNGRDLQADYIFTCSGGDVRYCGSTGACVWFAKGFAGLFSSLTRSGAYLEAQYAGDYSETNSLDHCTLHNGEVRKERVSVTGRPIGAAADVLISRTEDEALYAASRLPAHTPVSMTWQELNERGWDSFLALYDAQRRDTCVDDAAELSADDIDRLCDQMGAVIAANVAESWGAPENLEHSEYIGCYVLSRSGGTSGPQNYLIVVFRNDVLISIPKENISHRLSYYFTLRYTDYSVIERENALWDYEEPDSRVQAGVPGHNFYYNGYKDLQAVYNSLVRPYTGSYTVSSTGELPN